MAKSVAIAPKWVATLTTQDEYGQDEKWVFHFRRPSTRAMLSFTKATSGVDDNEKVAFVVEALRGVVLKATCNGQPCELDDMPFDLFEEVLGLHPTFRDTPNEGA